MPSAPPCRPQVAEDPDFVVVLRYLPDVPIKVTYPADLAIAEVLRSQTEP
jgi:hypothetical protein